MKRDTAPVKNQRKNILDDDHIGKLLLKLSIPAFFGMFVMTLYNVVDTIFIGRFVGPLGIAGLSIVFPIQMLSMGIGQMTGMGGASLISRLIGRGDNEKAERALGNAITSCVGLSVFIMIIGLANIDFWLKLVGASSTILPYSRDYLSIILIGMVPGTIAMSFNGWIRAEGNARVSMVGMIIGAGLNIIFDAIFIVGLRWGVSGAAWATVISQLISVLYFLSYFFTGKSFLKIHLRNLVPNLEILRGIFAIGISAFAMTIAGSISAIFVNRMFMQYGGDLAMSAYGILQRIMMFAMMPGMVIGQGLQPILGFNYGAKRYDRALRAIKLTMTLATIISMSAFIVLYFFNEPLIRVFTNDSGLIQLASHAARRIWLAMYLIGFIMAGSMIFQSMGKAVQSFIAAISRPALFLLPMVFILPQFWDLDGVWLAFPITDALTFILVISLLIPQIRLLRRMNVAGATIKQMDNDDRLQTGLK
jgi:putative MATE family efflux protein